MEIEKLKCPICKNAYDSSLHIPKILINCGHTICSFCISLKIHENEEHKIICPNDLIIYNNITSVNLFPTNRSLLDLIEIEKKNNNKNNLEIEIEEIHTPPELMTPQSTTSLSSDFLRKSNSLRNSLKKIPSNICLNHSLPLNVICIDEKIKICSQCALQSNHFNHQIITDDEFMNQIDNLIDLFQDVDNNCQKYSNKENISTSFVLNNLCSKIKLMKENMDKNINELIDNINKQKNIVFDYLEERKNEIKKKFNSTSYDIRQLIEQTNTWMNFVQNKLSILNDIKDPSIECIKLIDDDPNKNNLKLIQTGRQLNDRFSFIQQLENIIKDLELFEEKGISIEFNKKLVNEIIISKPVFDNKIVKTNLFNISENIELVNKLNLKNYIFENYNSNIVLNYIMNEQEDNNLSESKQYKLLNRESNLTTEKIINDLNELEHNISEKNSFTNELENNFEKKSKSFFNASQDEGNIFKDSNNINENLNSFNISRINLSTDNTKEKLRKKTSNHSPLNKQKSTTPDKDKIIFIKTQLKNEMANFSRIDIGDEGINIICSFFKNKPGIKYKELKFVKSNLTNEGVNTLIDGIKNYNIKIQNLNISNNGLNDKCGNSIINLLKYNYCSLRTFYLSNNSFTVNMKEKIKSYSTNVGIGNVKIFI